MANTSPGWRVGSLRGVPVYIGRSWVFIAVIIVATFGPQVSNSLPDLGGAAYVVAGLYVVGLLISVLVHEGAHALVGQARGYSVEQIVADLWGGHTSFSKEHAHAGSSALVAAVGPLSNAALAAVGFGVLQADLPDVPALLIGSFAWANAFVAAFNLLPGLPLDGGYLLEALVWKITGSRPKGTVVAGWTGRILTVLVLIALVVIPFANGHRPSLFTVAWAALIGSFLWFGAGAAIMRGKVTQQLSTVSLRDVLRPITAVDLAAPVASLSGLDTLVTKDGQPYGFVVAGAAMQVPLERRATTAVEALVELPSGPWVVTLDDHGDLNEIVAGASMNGLADRTIVLDRDGQLLGWVHRDELIRAVDHALTPGR
ncbi:site-2 protease family protein [Calidifontibacter terrae]